MDKGHLVAVVRKPARDLIQPNGSSSGLRKPLADAVAHIPCGEPSIPERRLDVFRATWVSHR
jgi:hypothetical protein